MTYSLWQRTTGAIEIQLQATAVVDRTGDFDATRGGGNGIAAIVPSRNGLHRCCRSARLEPPLPLEAATLGPKPAEHAGLTSQSSRRHGPGVFVIAWSHAFLQRRTRMVRMFVASVALAAVTLVPVAAGAQSKGSGQASAKPAVVGTININTASAADLQRLPGIGAKTAGRVIEYRQKNGPFKKVEELMNVRGVGEKNFLKLKGQISVAAARAEQHAAAQ